MIRMFCRAFAIAAACVLAACGGSIHPINPPNASVQQLDVLPDGRWKLLIRLENFSDKTVHYATLKAALTISGYAAADISLNPDMDIPGENADTAGKWIQFIGLWRREYYAGIERYVFAKPEK